MSSSQEFLAKVRQAIQEIPVEEVSHQQDEFTLVDVREDHEWDDGHIPGAAHVARGFLETRIESIVPDKSAPLVVYCASGTRSALAAHTLQENLGYENVKSLAGGITLWKDLGNKVETPFSLSVEQKSRYSRHLLLPEIGMAGQQKLLQAKVLMIGAGGLGSPVGLYLAAAGVGTLGIVDDDVVDRSNLQRQVLHTEESIGMPKTESAQKALQALNPDVTVREFNTRLTVDNVMDILSGYDMVIDGTDNFPTRYLLNDASVKLGIPVVSASILGFDGQLTVFSPGDGPCYRCLYPTPPPAELAPSCGANGVLGALPGVIGTLQAMEAIKLITETGEALIGRLLLYEALDPSFSLLKIQKDPKCPVCSLSPAELEALEFPDYQEFCAV